MKMVAILANDGEFWSKLCMPLYLALVISDWRDITKGDYWKEKLKRFNITVKNMKYN